MSLLILQTQNPKHSIASDSYGVIATAAMLDQTVTVIYCGEGLNQLKDKELIEQLQNCLEFGVEDVYACGLDSVYSLGHQIENITPEHMARLVSESESVLSF